MFKEDILPWWHKLTWFSKMDVSISGSRFKQVIQFARTFKAYDSFDSFLFPVGDFENTW